MHLVLGVLAEPETTMTLKYADSRQEAEDWCNENGGAKWVDDFYRFDHILIVHVALVDGGTPTC